MTLNYSKHSETTSTLWMTTISFTMLYHESLMSYFLVNLMIKKHLLYKYLFNYLYIDWKYLKSWILHIYNRIYSIYLSVSLLWSSVCVSLLPSENTSSIIHRKEANVHRLPKPPIFPASMATMATAPEKKHVFDGPLARPSPQKGQKNVSQEPAAEDETLKMSDEIPTQNRKLFALCYGHEYLLHWRGNIHLKNSPSILPGGNAKGRPVL